MCAFCQDNMDFDQSKQNELRTVFLRLSPLHLDLHLHCLLLHVLCPQRVMSIEAWSNKIRFNLIDQLSLISAISGMGMPVQYGSN